MLYLNNEGSLKFSIWGFILLSNVCQVPCSMLVRQFLELKEEKYSWSRGRIAEDNFGGEMGHILLGFLGYHRHCDFILSAAGSS